MTKFFVDNNGRYLGGFDGAKPPAGAIEVPAPPAHGRNRWVSGAWQEVAEVPEWIPMLNAHLVLIEDGWMPDVRAYLDGLTGIEGEQARAYFDKAQTMRRDHPLVQGFPRTDAEKDALFIKAKGLDV